MGPRNGTEKVERHQNAPRPDLPTPVANALQYDEPDIEDIDVKVVDELDAGGFVVEDVHRRSEQREERPEVQGEDCGNKSLGQDTEALDELF